MPRPPIHLPPGHSILLSIAGSVSVLLVSATPTMAETCNEWSVMTAPNPDNARASFNSLKVIAPDDVWAVGQQRSFVSGSDFAPLAAHFDGTSWSLVPVPNPAWTFDRQAWLYDVDAVATDDVWAVGAFIHPGEADLETFVVRWDGTEWSWIESPTQANGEGSLFYDVEVKGADDVWAVGAWPGPHPGAIVEPLAAHWDGQEWTTTTVPFEFDDSRLHDLDALTPTDIWAIGNLDFVTAGPIAPLIVRYDGSSWDFVDPRPPAEYHGTGDLAVIATDDVWVSASRWNEGDPFNPIPVFLHWDGSTWTEYANPGGAEFIVSAPDDIRAVSMNAISHWDGQAWTLISEMNLFPNDPYAFIHDAASYDGCSIWAAGKTGVANDVRTMLVGTGLSACSADLDGDGTVGFSDVLALLAAWGPCTQCVEDLDDDGTVAFADLLQLISAWGPCV